MTGSDPKAELRFYLTRARDALLWKLDGLSEYDIRRPLVPTGTNLLGLVKHVASVASYYFGECFDRPFTEPMPWLDDDADPNAGMWATAEESRDQIAGLYRRVWVHADTTIDALALDATGEVPWWSPERRYPTLHRVLIHMIAEAERHAGHADIVRELIDGSVGIRAEHSNLPDLDAARWLEYRDRVERAARSHLPDASVPDPSVPDPSVPDASRTGD
ncbi:DinB family protein [Rugosimonospora africana]|nr:DinB family protein [Rugosimonospora africana]